jgi:hypothetical protein
VQVDSAIGPARAGQLRSHRDLLRRLDRPPEDLDLAPARLGGQLVEAALERRERVVERVEACALDARAVADRQLPASHPRRA